MHIKRLVLFRYKRFSLKEVEKFEFEPDSNLIIFKWGNGVGKSSLLQQLNPLPADLKKDFLDGGFKEIHIEHLNKNYILISKDGKHNFIEDGIELNQGGTKKAQLELVEEKFKLNSNILSVVNGYSRFSIMSPSERKFWLTKISSVDYTYVIGIYNKLLEMKRDNSGTIKSSKDNLALFEKELLDIGDIQSIIKEQEDIKIVIEDLLKSYIHTKDVEELDNVINNIKSTLSNIYNNSIFKNRVNLEGIDINSLTIKESKIIERMKSITKEEDRVNKYLNLFDNKLDNDEINRLNKKLLSLESIIKPYKELLDTSIQVDNIISESRTFYINIIKRYESFQSYLQELPISESDLKINVTDSIININKELGGLQLILDKVNESSSFLDKTIIKNITCNSCGNSIPFSGIKDDLNNNLKSIEAKKESLLKRLNTLNLIKNAQDLLNSILSDLKRFDKVTTLKLILDKFISTDLVEEDYTSIDKIKLIIDTISGCITLLNDKYIPSYKDYISTSEILKEETIKLSTIKSLGLNNLEPLKKELLDLQNERSNLINNLTSIREFKNNFIEFTTLLEDIKNLLSRYRKLQCESKKILNNKTIELLVSDLKVKLSEMNTITDKRKELQVKIKMLTNIIIDKEDDNSIINILLKILSPTNGLIAKSVNSFIGKIIHDMNLIINSVWSYKMKLLPCEISETSDLDYKIRVEVNDSFIIEDISKLSSSMQEIVDLAFRIVFIKYMDFHTLPLILDEFGRTMDQEHRIQAFNMIDEVLCKTYDQVFLVSHFEEMYGRFKNATFPEIK